MSALLGQTVLIVKYTTSGGAMTPANSLRAVCQCAETDNVMQSTGGGGL